jgi:[ribosomal protein S5]-alanine N-acetyltransferase
MEKNELKGRDVTLRPLQIDQIDNYLKAFSPEVQSALFVDSPQSEREYLEECIKKSDQGDAVFFCIFDNLQNNIIGAIEIRPSPQHSGQLYCWLNEGYRGKGILRDAMRLAAEAYFMLTGRIFFNAHVDICNHRSYRALKKCGFADMGMSRGPRGMQYELILRRK